MPLPSWISTTSSLPKPLRDAAVKKLDRALELGPQYRRSGSLRDQDVFDLQALVLLFRTLVALVGTSDDVAEKLLTLLAWSKDELGDYQRRVLKPTSVTFRRLHPVLFKSLSMECRDALHTFETTQVKISTFESRWMRGGARHAAQDGRQRRTEAPYRRPGAGHLASRQQSSGLCRGSVWLLWPAQPRGPPTASCTNEPWKWRGTCA